MKMQLYLIKMHLKNGDTTYTHAWGNEDEAKQYCKNINAIFAAPPNWCKSADYEIIESAPTMAEKKLKKAHIPEASYAIVPGAE